MSLAEVVKHTGPGASCGDRCARPSGSGGCCVRSHAPCKVIRPLFRHVDTNKVRSKELLFQLEQMAQAEGFDILRVWCLTVTATRVMKECKQAKKPRCMS